MDTPTAKKRRIRSPSCDPDDPDTQPAPVLDANAFPHLIDLIITFAPLDALPTLRLTCHYIRNRVDDLFPRHIAFEKDGTISAKNHKGKWVNGAPFDPSFVKIVDYRNTPVEGTPHGSKSTSTMSAPLHRTFLRGTSHAAYFVDQDSPSSVTSRPHRLSDAGLHLDLDSEELVINIRYPCTLPALSNLDLVSAELYTDLTSILVTPWRKEAPGQHSPGTATQSEPRNGWSYTVTHLADIVRIQLEDFSDLVQIVGIEVWGSKVFGPPRNRRSASDKCHWEQEFFDDFTFTLVDFGCDDLYITDLKRRVSFISLDEYRTHVGDEQFKLGMDAWE